MPRHGISYEQVVEAADKIVTEGRQPTIKAVRKELGTGSESTILEHLRKWRENQVINAEIEKRYGEHRRAKDAEIARLESNVTNLNEAVREKDEKIDELNSEIETIKAELAAAGSKNLELAESLKDERLTVKNLRECLSYKPEFETLKNDILQAVVKAAALAPAKEAPVKSQENDRPFETSQEEIQPQNITEHPDPKETKTLFQQGYNALEHGGHYVRICDLRRYLNWSADVFDATMISLRDARKLQLQGGDTDFFTAEDIRDCFVDENGLRKLTMMWRGEPTQKRSRTPSKTPEDTTPAKKRGGRKPKSAV